MLCHRKTYGCVFFGCTCVSGADAKARGKKQGGGVCSSGFVFWLTQRTAIVLWQPVSCHHHQFSSPANDILQSNAKCVRKCFQYRRQQVLSRSARMSWLLLEVLTVKSGAIFVHSSNHCCVPSACWKSSPSTDEVW